MGRTETRVIEIRVRYPLTTQEVLIWSRKDRAWYVSGYDCRAVTVREALDLIRVWSTGMVSYEGTAIRSTKVDRRGQEDTGRVSKQQTEST